MKCINRNHEDFKSLLKETGKSSLELELDVAAWQQTQNSDLFPTAQELYPEERVEKINYQKLSTEELVASEKTLRDLAARMSDRIGIPYKIISDRTQKFKGKLEKGYNSTGFTAVINLAYASLDTPIHEILGHPIIKAIKSKVDIISEENNLGDENTPFQLGKINIGQGKGLYQNLLKELETGRGKEVLDRVKRDYVYKESLENLLGDPLPFGPEYNIDGKDFNTKEEALKYIEQRGLRNYTLEEQQEEALVELLGLMTAGKLDNVKDGKLISLLKRLLKEMKAFLRSLIKQKEVEIDNLPDNMTLGDLSDLLAYSNSKLILPGYEVEYTTPDNMKFKTYQEASNHISELSKNIKNVDLDRITINKELSKSELDKIKELSKQQQKEEDYLNSKEYQEEKNKQLKELNDKLSTLENKKPIFYKQEPTLDLEDISKYGFKDYSYVRVESSYSRQQIFDEPLWEKHFGKDFEGYYIHGYNTEKGKPDTKVLKITKEEAENIWKKQVDTNPFWGMEYNEQQEHHRLKNEILLLTQDDSIKWKIISLKRKIEEIKLGTNSLAGFIEKNKEYEQAKEIIEEWKKLNNIKYNPDEIYSRGQEFSSVVGAYSSFDVNLMMQNLLSHIEDNEKSGGKFAISAYTKPIDKKIGHLEGGGGKIKFKIYPKSEDILWAANTDVYSGSVWDASTKVNKDKKSELLGVSYTKYPALQTIYSVQPNLANIVDDIQHAHNELGIVLTENNFRLEYDEDIPYTTKRIIDGINKILDQKHGKVVKPEIKKQIIKEETTYALILLDDDGEQKAVIKTGFKTLEEAKEFGEKNKDNYIKYSGSYMYLDITEKIVGIEPTQTNETLKESIRSVRDKVSDEVEDTDGSGVYGYNVGSTRYIHDTFDNIFSKSEDGFITWKNITKEEYENNKPKKNTKKKEYTNQALVVTKIAALKEVAKKYPRSLIRSEVKKETNTSSVEREWFGDELPFQKLQSSLDYYTDEDFKKMSEEYDNFLMEEYEYLSKPNEISYKLKAVEILNTTKAKKTFEKGEKNSWPLNKILTELQIPKEQRELILEFGLDKRTDILERLKSLQFSVEINIAKTNINSGGAAVQELDDLFIPTIQETFYFSYREGWFKEDRNQNRIKATTEELQLIEEYKNKNAIHNSEFYSNLTVPGGANYTEQEIATPQIVPSIKGHAQFSTPSGIGWFRADESQQYQETDIQSIIDNLQKSGQLEINCK